MSNGKKLVERRKYKRFQVPKRLFAGLGPDYIKVGPIVDISTRGLAFRYVDRGEPSNGTHVEIFMTEGDFYLGKLPVKTIWDVEVVDERPSGNLTVRVCAVQFGDLTPDQIRLLEYFIENHTVGEV